MKTKILYVIISFLLLSCGNEDDFELPEVEITEPEIEGEIVGVESVRNLVDYENLSIHTFQETDAYMKAYVVSSDETGNFYHELILQDKASNPTAGIRLLLNRSSLFQSFQFGRLVYVKLDGLSVGVSNGVPVLGMRNNGNVGEIPFPLIDEHVLRSTEVAQIQPLVLSIDDFSEEYKNLYVKINNVQFIHNLVGEDPATFAAEIYDEFDGDRMLVSCETGATTFVSTSTYADFRFLELPSGKGSVTGILGRNFYDDYYVLNLNAASEVNFSNQNRCDPEFLDCNGAESGGSEIIFYEDFQNITNTASIVNVLGWENINVSGSSGIFSYKNSYGNKFITVSAYDTGEAPMTAWLVTPEINMDSSTNEEFAFNARASFDNGTILTVYAAENYTGNPLTTEWTQLDANIPSGPSGAAAPNFSDLKINVSCLSGNVRFGFRYHGADPDRTTTYDIDNVRVTGYSE